MDPDHSYYVRVMMVTIQYILHYNFRGHFKYQIKQECIPVGCVLAAH